MFLRKITPCERVARVVAIIISNAKTVCVLEIVVLTHTGTKIIRIMHGEHEHTATVTRSYVNINIDCKQSSRHRCSHRCQEHTHTSTYNLHAITHHTHAHTQPPTHQTFANTTHTHTWRVKERRANNMCSILHVFVCVRGRVDFWTCTRV